MEVTSTEVQNNFGTYLKYAQYENINITRNGKIVAVLQGYESFCVAEGQPACGHSKPKLTLNEFLDFTSKSDKRYELINGEVFLLASSSFEHQNCVLALGSIFREWSKKVNCEALVAPFDITLETEGTTNILQPDVMIICDLEKIDEAGRYEGIPTLVVEVLSKSSMNHDLIRKLDVYRAGGIQEYWIVNPFSQEIYIYVFSNLEVKDYKVYKSGCETSSSVFPGLRVEVDSIFS